MKKSLFIIALLNIIFFISFGQITFQKAFQSNTFGSEAHSVQQTSDGGYIIAGFTSGSFTDIYLIKTDINGDTVWTKSFGMPYGEIANEIQETNDGGYIITGTTDIYIAGGWNVFLIKIDSNGGIIWIKRFGGPNYDYGNSVQETTDGGFIIAGSTNSFGGGGAYLIRTNSTGDTLWTRCIVFSNSVVTKCVRQTIDGGFIITGSAGGGVSNDVYLLKTDSTGFVSWAKFFVVTGDDKGNCVRQTIDGGYIITGIGYYGGFLIKTNSVGDTLWTRYYGISEANSVQQTIDGGYIVAGACAHAGSVVNYDLCLIKTNAVGDTLWTKSYGGGTFDEEGFSVQQTTDLGYIVVGYSLVEIYMIKTDLNGNSNCNQGGIAGFLSIQPLQVTNIVTSISTGAIISSPPITIGSGGAITTICTTVGINELTTDNLVLISPNPSVGNFIISFEGTFKKGNVEIVNILGKTVFTENIFNQSKKEINLKNVYPGIYFVKVFDGERQFCKKIIIE
ncbi:MAG TPA: T9SS type A sorting domain-containing protein [Bacteroidia bacterium]|nr:T9SS type A sorting domain-containing protein [Bacteroidia bacterium]